MKQLALTWTISLARVTMTLVAAATTSALTVAYVLSILAAPKSGLEEFASRLVRPFQWVLQNPPTWPLTTFTAFVTGAVLFYPELASFLARLRKAGVLKAEPALQEEGGVTSLASQNEKKP